MFKFYPYEIRVYIIDYKKKKVHQHRHPNEKKKHVTDISADVQSTDTTKPKASLTKRRKVVLKKHKRQISNNAFDDTEEARHAAAILAVAKMSSAASSSKSESEKVVPSNNAEIDLENESIEKKRERQRSLVLNLGQ